MSDPSTTDNLPVGTILAFAADDVTLLPSDWAVCNGAQYSTTSNSDLFAMIGYSNGGSGTVFYLPDLRGQFIRGSGNGVPAAGTVLPATTQMPKGGFSLSLQYIPNDYHHVDQGAIGPASRNMVPFNSGSTSYFSVTGGDKETRPVNVYMNYIIKVAVTTTQIPIGAVIPYAGSDDNAPFMPQWLACNGNTYSATTSQFSPLYQVIGSRFYSQTGTANFSVPSLTGIFIRGVDAGAGRDPDANNRLPPPNNDTGPVVGTLQKYATSAAGMQVNVPHFPPDGPYEVYPTLGHNNLHAANFSSATSFTGGDRESRPKNASVQYYISAMQLSTGSDGFPVGGIIAIPGGGIPNTSYWKLADGSSVAKSDCPALWAIMQLQNPPSTAWGTADDDHFNLPNLNGKFLRATDSTNASSTDTWGDPDRFSRQASAAGGTTVGTGSVQSYATGAPQNAFQASLSYPTDVVANAATAVGPQMSEYNSSSQSFPLSFQGTAAVETAPTSVSVRFFVKYASAT